MDPRASIPLVPLHLTALAILSPNNAPLYVHSFTGPADELRHYHLAHAAVDVIEERSGWRDHILGIGITTSIPGAVRRYLVLGGGTETAGGRTKGSSLTEQSS
jgi:hypothetical protein